LNALDRVGCVRLRVGRVGKRARDRALGESSRVTIVQNEVATRIAEADFGTGNEARKAPWKTGN